MAQERRWNIVLRVVSGPLASDEEQTFRGPKVEVGTNPSTGGVRLPSGRGVAPQHCTITAYAPQQVFVTPVGHNPVRLALYSQVNWEDLEPISQRVFLKPGNAIHLGPTGKRGITLEFVACRDLGMYEVDGLHSDGADVDEVVVADHERPPDGIQAKAQRPSVRSIVGGGGSISWVWAVFAGMVTISAVFMTIIVVTLLGRHSVVNLQDGQANWDDRDFQWSVTDRVEAGFEAPLRQFIVRPNIQLAGESQDHGLATEASTWDPKFFYEVEREFEWLGRKTWFYKRLHEIHDDYATVVSLLREEGLPEVFAGIPMQESEYKAGAISQCCAKGWWQFMPEFGARFRAHPAFGPDYDVRECAWRGLPGAQRFTPVHKAPPPFSCSRGEYVLGGSCALTTCDMDFRTDLEKSTRVAMHTLGEALRDPYISRSGAAVQIAIASHHAGYDDSRVYEQEPKPSKPKNLLPTYLKWDRQRPDDVPTSHFYGDVMRCDSWQDPADGCQRFMVADTQRYTVKIVAGYLVAVCFYSKYHPDDEAFAYWRKYAGREDSYCEGLQMPTPSDLEGLQ